MRSVTLALANWGQTMPQLSTSNSSTRLLDHADDFARREPAKAVATGFGLGFLLYVLPLGAIASMLVSLLFALARPALLLLGVLKAFDFARVQVPSGQAERN